MTIRFGDAGAVTWTINGRDAGSPGDERGGQKRAPHAGERGYGELA